MSEDQKRDEKETPEHVHRLSGLKDREFHEQSDLILRYFRLATHAADCPHTDSPIVDAVETVAYSYWRAAPLPNSPALRAVFMEMMQSMGNAFFVAGMRFALDGQRLDSDKFMGGELPEQEEDNRWSKERAEIVAEWREDMRRKHYIPPTPLDPVLKAALEKLVGREIPDDVRILDTGEGSFGIGIPVQSEKQEEKEAPPGTGFYA